MTLPDLSLVMGLIIISTFTTIFIITMLGLLKIVTIERRYLQPLFTALILEIIPAGFFLFYKISEPQNISYDPQEVYTFDASGEAVNLKIFQDGTLVKEFNKIPNYKSIPREAEVENNRLYFTTKKGEIYLGYIDKPGEKLAHKLLTCQMALYLGSYLSEFEKGKRRNPHQAVKYLLHVLRVGSESEDREKEVAVIRLHKLLTYMKQSDDFKLLLRMIDNHRSGYNKYFELAETYLIYALQIDRNREEKNKAALKCYLLFLSTPESEEETLNVLKDTAKDRAKELVKIALAGDEYIKPKRADILADINNHNRPALRNYSQNIPLLDLSKLD